MTIARAFVGTWIARYEVALRVRKYENISSHGKKFGRDAALPLVLLRHYTGGQLQRSS